MTHTTQILSIQGDSVDSICWRYYGYSSGVVEQVLQANPHLARFDIILPIGTPIGLPNIDATPSKQKVSVQLWD